MKRIVRMYEMPYLLAECELQGGARLTNCKPGFEYSVLCEVGFMQTVLWLVLEQSCVFV